MVVGPVARRHPIYVEDARFVVGETSHPVKYTLPGPMTMVDTLYDGHYKSREKLAFAFAEILNEEARAIEAGGRRGGPVRRARVQRLLRRGARLGHGGARARRVRPALQDRGPHLLRLRHQGQHRVEEDAGRASGGSTSRRFPCSPGRPSTRCRSNARTPTSRSSSSALLAGKDVLVGAIDVANDQVETPDEVAATIRAAMAFVPADRLLALHQLRHGAAVPGSGPRQAPGPGRRRRHRPPGTSRKFGGSD